MRARDRLEPLSQSVVGLVLLAVVTFGVYQSYWFYKNAPLLNRLTKAAPVQRGFTVVALALAFATAAFSILDLVAGETQKPNSGAHDLDRLVTLALALVLVALAFRVRRILEGFATRIQRPRKLSGLATFFFNVFYLQFAINRMLRELDLEKREPSIRGALAKE